MVFDQFLYHCLYNETYNPPVAPVAAAALPPEAENAPSRTGKEAENAPSRTGKHSGPWRTEQRQNRAQKVPNVPSETLEKQ